MKRQWNEHKRQAERIEKEGQNRIQGMTFDEAWAKITSKPHRFESDEEAAAALAKLMKVSEEDALKQLVLRTRIFKKEEDLDPQTIN